MRDVYLDCSGLHNIRLDSQLPSTIEIDGRVFNQELQSILQDFVIANQKTTEQKRWELIVSLASNPAFVESNETMISHTGTAIRIVRQASAIIKELDK